MRDEFGNTNSERRRKPVIQIPITSFKTIWKYKLRKETETINSLSIEFLIAYLEIQTPKGDGNIS